jgi:hypothetical protein
MTLEEATRATHSAAEARDLEAVAKALVTRAEAIAGGGVPTPEIIATGERTLELLRALVRSGKMESVRLGQIQASLAGSLSLPPNIDYRG